MARILFGIVAFFAAVVGIGLIAVNVTVLNRPSLWPEANHGPTRNYKAAVFTERYHEFWLTNGIPNVPAR